MLMHSSNYFKRSSRHAAHYVLLLLTFLLCLMAGADTQAQSKKRAQPKKQAQSAKQSKPKSGAKPRKDKDAKKKPQVASKQQQPKKQTRRTREPQPAKRARPQRNQTVAIAKPKPRIVPAIDYEQPVWPPADVPPQPRPRPVVAGNVIVLPQLVNPNNFGPSRRPNFVVIHHTGQKTCDETLLAFSLPQAEVSSHYLVCRDGTVYQALSDSLRAHHAGVGQWGTITDMNSCSIGIELDNNGSEPFGDAQIRSLLGLLGQLKTRYAIPAANFIGHGDYAVGRKSDPSVLFPWRLLAEQGFGRWYSPPRDTVPAGFDWRMAMRVVGYDMRDSVAATRAFKRHFMQAESPEPINDADREVLYQLSR